MTNEKIYDIYWEGPFAWENRKKAVKPYHVLYQLYGAHHHYGRDVLLYIGRTARGIDRLKEHEWWVRYEYDDVRIRAGSLGEFTDWQDWDKGEHYPNKASDSVVKKIEALLICANQPVYNQASKNSASIAKDIRVFNTGKLGQLFPEVSFKYFFED